jgi:nitroreductase
MKEKDSRPFNPELINELIRARRSVFVNQLIPGKKIPDQIIRQILENANWAPTHKQTEPWRFTVFSGKGLEKLALFQSQLYKSRAGEKFKNDKYQKLLDNPAKCSHVIAIGLKRSHASLIPELEEIAAVACAVENIYLSVTAYGLGGYWTTGGVTYMQEAKSFFNLNPEDILMGFFYLGYVAIPSPAGIRKPVWEKIQWVSE